MSSFVRGRVYRARPQGFREDKYFLVVSNNMRNRNLESALAVRFTSSSMPGLPSIIIVGEGEVVAGGRIVCDDIYELYEDELKADVGAVSPSLMSAVNQGLKAALGIADH